MLLRRVMLFLFGATIASAQFAPGPLEFAMMPSGCPPASEVAPMICKLMQQHLAFQYKPQLIAPSTYIPPLVLEKCDTPKLEQEIEFYMPAEEKKPIIIPEAPVLPPITLPKFPVPVMFEEPILTPAAEPCQPASAPELPEIPEFNQIVEVPEIKKPVMIPQPPELPAFVVPELPVRKAESSIIVEPEEQPMHVPALEYIEPLAVIPAAPELHLVEPVIPEIVELPKVDFKLMEIPQPPELPAFVMPELPVRMAEPPMVVEPCPEEQPMHVPEPEYIEHLEVIPAAPELHLAELPVFPEIVELPKVDLKTVEIPQPPELPVFVMPELPVRMAEPPMTVKPYPEEQPMHEPVSEYIESLAAIPAAPELHLPELPVFPEIVDLPKVDLKTVKIPQTPQLPEFVMPELPLAVPEQPMVVEPWPENELMRIVPVPEFIRPLAPIPVAPGLPPNMYILPEVPVHIDWPTYPIIPKMITKEPCATGEVILTKAEPVFIPELPRVPEFMMPEPIHVEEKPALPAYHEAAIIADPCEPYSHKTIKMSDLAPYFVRNTPYVFGKGKVLSLPYEYMHRF